MEWAKLTISGLYYFQISVITIPVVSEVSFYLIIIRLKVSFMLLFDFEILNGQEMRDQIMKLLIFSTSWLWLPIIFSMSLIDMEIIE